MLIGQKGVKYGLTVPKQKAKQAAPAAKKKSVFGDEDSDDNDAMQNVEQQIARQAARKQTDKKVADIHAAALAEDPSIFDYDAHYDDIQQSRVEPKRQEKVQRESKYIASLLEKAEERKREQDILYERQLAKERAAEDHLFGDKERYVTAAYRRKLEEDKKWQEEEEKKKAKEERDAVEKKGHMGDFYRNLFRSNVAFGAKAAEKPKQQEQEQAAEASHEAAAPVAPAEEPAFQEVTRALAAEGGGEAAAAGGWEAAKAARDAREGRGSGPGAVQRRQGGAGEPPGRAAGVEGQPAKHAQREEGRAPVGGEPGAGGQAQAGQAEGGGEAAAQGAPGAGAAQQQNREDAVAAARERYLARKRKAQ